MISLIIKYIKSVKKRFWALFSKYALFFDFYDYAKFNYLFINDI